MKIRTSPAGLYVLAGASVGALALALWALALLPTARPGLPEDLVIRAAAVPHAIEAELGRHPLNSDTRESLDAALQVWKTELQPRIQADDAATEQETRQVLARAEAHLRTARAADSLHTR